jgi:predicted metalloprotease
MTTVINNPGENNGGGSSGGAGVIIGAVLVVLVLVVVIVLSLPYIRQQMDGMTNQKIPAINPTINVQVPTIPSIPGTGTTTK